MLVPSSIYVALSRLPVAVWARYTRDSQAVAASLAFTRVDPAYALPYMLSGSTYFLLSCLYRPRCTRNTLFVEHEAVRALIYS